MSGIMRFRIFISILLMMHAENANAMPPFLQMRYFAFPLAAGSFVSREALPARKAYDGRSSVTGLFLFLRIATTGDRQLFSGMLLPSNQERTRS
jgi:hypothetical protein